MNATGGPPGPASAAPSRHLPGDGLDRPHLLIATDAGCNSILHAATRSQRYAHVTGPLLVLFGAGDSLPFKPRPSTIMVAGLPDGVIACAPSLDEFGIASRVASTAGLPGCYDGTVFELADIWLSALDPTLRSQALVIVSGADETLRAAEELGQRMGVSVRILS